MAVDFTTHKGININRTSYQGRIWVSFHTICSVFGHPLLPGDDKTDAEWHVEFSDGMVGTIYNYKNGKNYLGHGGTPTVEIEVWNVGGHSSEVFRRISDLLLGFSSR